MVGHSLDGYMRQLTSINLHASQLGSLIYGLDAFRCPKRALVVFAGLWSVLCGAPSGLTDNEETRHLVFTVLFHNLHFLITY